MILAQPLHTIHGVQNGMPVKRNDFVDRGAAFKHGRPFPVHDPIDSRGPVRVSEVEQQQRKVLQIVRNLAENGQIQLGGKAEDAYV